MVISWIEKVVLRCATGWSRLGAVQPVPERFWTRIALRWSPASYLMLKVTFSYCQITILWYFDILILWYCHGKGEGSIGGGNRSSELQSCVESEQGFLSNFSRANKDFLVSRGALEVMLVTFTDFTDATLACEDTYWTPWWPWRPQWPWWPWWASRSWWPCWID